MILTEKTRQELTEQFVANAHPDSIVGQLFPKPAKPTKPIRVYQCKQDCCVVRVPSRRFWFVRTPKGRETFSCFRDASFYAGWEALRLPQEVTA